jgi:hypothetical protein
MGGTEYAAALTALQDLFPSFDQAILKDVLHQSNNDLEWSAEQLLEMLPGAGPGSLEAVVGLSDSFSFTAEQQHFLVCQIFFFACSSGDITVPGAP